MDFWMQRYIGLFTIEGRTKGSYIYIYIFVFTVKKSFMLPWFHGCIETPIIRQSKTTLCAKPMSTTLTAWGQPYFIAFWQEVFQYFNETMVAYLIKYNPITNDNSLIVELLHSCTRLSIYLWWWYSACVFAIGMASHDKQPRSSVSH